MKTVANRFVRRPEARFRGLLAMGDCRLAAAWLLVGAVLATGCGGAQSALAPAGREADQIASLFWWMASGAAVIWLAVAALALFAIRTRMESSRGEQVGNWMIIGGGAIFPTVVLAVLLVYGLSMMPGLVARAPEGSLRIEVVGEQWWWRVRYLPPDGRVIDSANEIRLPVGQPVEFLLRSSNVIHSFWIPSLGGKRDMIPGRLIRLTLTPTKTGIFRGACAEYCGTSHALMSFYAVVMEQAEFSRWLDQEAGSAPAPSAPPAERGGRLFLANGCGACHAVRGTSARGVIGPDLTHVGSRLSVGAGIITNSPSQVAEWIARTDRLKPGVHMPAFGMLPPDDLRALAAYLEGLK